MIIDKNGIYISKKQASVTAAVLVVLALLLFVGGYFWGKQSVIDGFTQKTSQESFNDQVDYLLTMQSFAAKNGGVMPEFDADKEIKSEELLQNIPEAAEEVDLEKNSSKPVEATQSKSTKSYTHYAALAGFSKKASADQLAQRLKKHNIPVEVKTKTGKSASGKVRRTWYQVITKSYESVQEVQQIVDKILTFETIKRSDIKIV